MAEHWHRTTFEGKGALMAGATTVCILIGGLAEIVPTFDAKLGPKPIEGVEPYSPLELAGRDIYLRDHFRTGSVRWRRGFIR